MKELIFEDGRLPSQDVINEWLKIVDDFFDPKISPLEAAALEEQTSAAS